MGLSPDLLGAIRGLIRSRAVSLLALSNLALGIGASASMLSLLDVLVFRPPAHVEGAGALRRIYITETFPGIGDFTQSETSYPVFRDLERVRSFADLGAFFSSTVSLGQGTEARRIRAVLATPGFLRMLAVKPAVGRLFSDSEGQPGREGFVALLGYDFWSRGFDRAADIVGRQVTIGNDSFTVVGVLPKGFTGVDLEGVDVWLPMNSAGRFVGPEWAQERGFLFLEIVAKLRPGTPEAAGREATAALRTAAAEAGEPRSTGRVSLGPIQRARGPEAPAAVKVTAWLSGISWIVLLVACANVANLLLLRGLDRRRELALRLALGARRGDLARLLLFEGFLLAGLGAVAALGVFGLMSSALQRLVLPEAGVRIGLLDLRTVGIVTALAVVAGLLSGAMPALWASRGDLTGMIRGGVREGRPERSRWTAALAAGQIAMTLVLLMGAGDFARSLSKVLHLDLGMDADRVLVATIDLIHSEYSRSRVDEIFLLARERIRRLPGVSGASLAATIPFASSMMDALSVPGMEQLPRLSTGGPYVNAVSEDFFTTTGTPVLRGRPFTAGDRAGAAPVAIVNQSMARLLWPHGQALGQCLKVGGGEAPCSLVVGVVKDARRSELQEGPTMQYYIPLGQAHKLSSRALFVRTTGDSELLRGQVRREVQAVEPGLPFVEVRSLADLLAPQIHPWRMGAAVLTLFGLLALALAMVGLYGVMTHSLARRRYELGVRIALGAQWRDVRWLAVRQGLGIGLSGAVAGILLALGTARFVQPLLFQVSASDPALLTAAATLVLLEALLASYVPARRLRHLAPAEVLRVE